MSQKQNNISTGLVLEGGALRGLFSAGVMDVMMERGLTVDGMVGVSAGACFGVNYKSGQPGRTLRYNLRFAHDRRYCSVQSLVTTGDLFGAQFAYHDMPNRYDIFDNEAFRNNPIPFFLVCTDCRTGQPVYHECRETGDELYEWIRASASMPVASRPVNIGNQVLLDGGMTDSIPLAFMQQQGFGRNIVVLTQPIGFRKRPLSAVFRQILHRSLHSFPKMIEVMERRYKMYNGQLDYISQQVSAGNTFLIAPSDKLPIGRVSHSRNKMQRTYDMGREMMERRWEELTAFLNG
jgi:predicted patatin/cPLA2 family phospholipase